MRGTHLRLFNRLYWKANIQLIRRILRRVCTLMSEKALFMTFLRKMRMKIPNLSMLPGVNRIFYLDYLNAIITSMGSNQSGAFCYKATVIALLLLLLGLLAYVGYKVENLQPPQYQILKGINELNKTLQNVQASLKNAFIQRNHTSQHHHGANIQKQLNKEQRPNANAMRKINRMSKVLRQGIIGINKTISELNKGLNQKERLSEQLYKKMQVFMDYLKQVQEYLKRLIEPLTQFNAWF